MTHRLDNFIEKLTAVGFAMLIFSLLIALWAAILGFIPTAITAIFSAGIGLTIVVLAIVLDLILDLF